MSQIEITNLHVSIEGKEILKGVDLTVEQQPGLVLHGSNYARVAVTGVGHSNATGEIQPGFAVQIVQNGAFAALGDDVGGVRPNGRKVRNGGRQGRSH
jgi:Fe-S cluster assembly ATPase SufC